MKLTKSKLKQIIKEELEGEWVLKKTGKGGYVQKATSEKPSNIKSPNFEGSDPKIFKDEDEAKGWKKAAEKASGLALTVEPKESLSEGHGDEFEADKEVEKFVPRSGTEPGAMELRIRKLEDMVWNLLTKFSSGPLTPEQAEEMRRSATPFNEGVHKMKLTEESLKELIREEINGEKEGDQEEKLAGDVNTVLKYIDKVNTPNEYAQLVAKILNHNVKGKARALKIAGGKNGPRLAAMFPEA